MLTLTINGCSQAGKWHMNEMLQQTPEIVLFVLGLI